MGDVTHYAGDQCPGGHYEETTMRGTGGNRFIPADATVVDLERAITRGLTDLIGWADETGRAFDPGAVTIETRRIRNGRISVHVDADLIGDDDE